MRRALILVAATLVSLAAAAGPAEARKRCCFRAVISGHGFMDTTWGQLSNDQTGGDTALWSWRERHLLVYEERAGHSSLRHALIRGEPVKPSTVYYGVTQSTVRVGEPPNDRPAADPGACGETRIKLRLGVTPELRPRSTADQGALERFPNTVMFLSAGSYGAAHSGLGKDCLYGHHPLTIEGWADQPCPGQHHFWLPAPRRGWFRRGENAIEKSVDCRATHEPGENINHRFEASGGGRVRLSWFHPRRLEQEAERLKEAHRQDNPGSE